jgi:hypothetical protein
MQQPPDVSSSKEICISWNNQPSVITALHDKLNWLISDYAEIELPLYKPEF